MRQKLENKTFGELIVKEYDIKSQKWVCLCSCGKTTFVQTGHLNCGSVISCGHYRRENTIKRSTTHGMTNTKVFKAWTSMKDRITNKNNKKYHLYGGRGIGFCDRWCSFENFYEDVGNPPTKKHTLDRIDSNGDYEPDNVKWSTYTEQNNNRSVNNYISFNGETKTIAQWAKEYNLLWETLKARIKCGWSIERAITKKVRIAK